MIEQTELIIKKWHYHPPDETVDLNQISDYTFLEVMRKRTATKKGIACRFTCSFTFEEDTILEYVAEHSYVIDLNDEIDKKELLSMIRNSYTAFSEKFDFRKLATVLNYKSLRALDETMIDYDVILPLLK